LATWLFGAGVLSNVVIGRMPFTLGIALAVAAWLCIERAAASGTRVVAWTAGGSLLALGSVLAGPVAGGGRAESGRTAALMVPVVIGGGTMALLFPEGGDDRFVATAFWPMLAVA